MLAERNSSSEASEMPLGQWEVEAMRGRADLLPPQLLMASPAQSAHKLSVEALTGMTDVLVMSGKSSNHENWIHSTLTALVLSPNVAGTAARLKAADLLFCAYSSVTSVLSFHEVYNTRRQHCISPYTNTTAAGMCGRGCSDALQHRCAGRQ